MGQNTARHDHDAYGIRDGALDEEEWPALFERRHVKGQELDIKRLAGVWRGETDDEYSSAATISTAAIAIQLMGKAQMPDAALKLARKMWENRARDKTLAVT